jgi:hypothetical protein
VANALEQEPLGAGDLAPRSSRSGWCRTGTLASADPHQPEGLESVAARAFVNAARGLSLDEFFDQPLPTEHRVS